MTTPLIGPDGGKYDFNGTPEELAAAVKQGYRPEAEAPQTTLEAVRSGAREAEDTLTAGTFAGLQGMTGGLFGAGVGALEPKSVAQQALKAKEESPIASGVGEFAGMVASPLNLVGGAAARGVGATTRLGRIGAEGVGGAATFGLMGAGSAISDAALGDQQLTAEKLVAGAGLGALLGGAGGLLGGAITEVGHAAVPALKRAIPGAEESLLKIRDLFGMKAAGAMAKDFRAANYRGNARELVDLLIEKGVMKPGGVIDDVAESAVALAKQTGERQGALAKELDAAGAMIDGAKVAQDVEALASKYVGGNVGDKAIAKRLSAEAEALADAGQIPLSRAEELKRGFDKFLKYGAEQSPMQEGLKQTRGILNAANESAAKSTGSALAEDWLKAKKEMGLLAQVQDFSVSRAEALKANRTISLTDYLSGGAGLVGGALAGGDSNRVEGAVTGALLGLANKQMRQRLPSLIAHAAEAIAKSPSLSVVAESLAKTAPELTPKLGSFSGALAEAFAKSPAMGLATHVALTQTEPSYAAAAELAGLTPEAADEHGAAMGKAAGIATMAAALVEQDKAISEGIARVAEGKRTAVSSPVLKSQDFGSKRTYKDAATSHGSRVDEIRMLATDPNALVDRVTANLGKVGDVAPGVSAALTATANRAVQYLVSQSQTPPKAGPLAKDWVPTKAERHEFTLRLETVQNPMSVMTHAANGTLTRLQLDALNAVYPSLARQIQNQALEALVTAPPSMPYRSRQMLALLTGVDPDGTMGAVAIARNQTAINAGSRKPSAAVPQQPSGSNSELTLGSRMAPPTQRRERGDET